MAREPSKRAMPCKAKQVPPGTSPRASVSTEHRRPQPSEKRRRKSRSKPLSGLDVADAYAKSVVDGTQAANVRVRAQARRYLEAREAGEWDGERLDRLLEHARKAYGWEPMPWAVWVFAHVVAWRSGDLPACRFVVLQVARGVGKTQMAAMLSSWTVEEAARAGKKNCEVVVLATQMDKAALVQERIREAMGEDTEWEFYGGKMSTVGALSTHPGGSIKCRPSTVKNADGITPTLLVCDEAARMDETFTRAITSMTKVRGAQMLVITTPDSRQYENPYGAMIRGIERALETGEPLPASTVGIVYGIDADDAPDDPEAWVKACPTMGVHKTVEDYRVVMGQTLATGNPRDREEWYTQQLATFTDDLAGGLPLALYDACVEDWSLEDARGLPGVISVDFSQGGWASGCQFDLTSINLAAWDGERLLSRSWHYWAGSDIVADEGRSRQPLREWRDTGHLVVFGNTVDYSVLERQLQTIAALVQLKHFVADPAGKAAAWCDSMERRHGWPWSRAPQNVVFMGSAWSIWADMIRGRKIRFALDPVLRTNLAHTRLRPGDTGLFVPSKGRSSANIDAVTACCMAVKVMNDREMLSRSMYGDDPRSITF